MAGKSGSSGSARPSGSTSSSGNDDIKERMRLALEAKNRKSAKNTPHGSAPVEGKATEHADREGGKREFRRKSGG